MRGLCLHGMKCTTEIWREMADWFSQHEIELVEYPHSILQDAKTPGDLTNWFLDTYQDSYEVIIGHSMGGIIALEAASRRPEITGNVIMIDTNVKPAGSFYRNLMMPKHETQWLNFFMKMSAQEESFYADDLKAALQKDFDYTAYIKQITYKIHVIYVDRGRPDYVQRLDDLHLETAILDRLDIRFVKDSCHLPMLENPLDLTSIIQSCIQETR